MLLLAITTAPIHLAHILSIEVLDGNCAAAVVLQYFVICVSGATAVYVGGTGGLFEGGGVLAYIGPLLDMSLRLVFWL
jgi:hypothetical protein